MSENADRPDALAGYRERSSAALVPESGSPDVLRGRLLVIEDVADLRLLLRTALSSFGLPIVEVADGRIAAGLIGAMAPPSLVIVDRMLPFVQGDELIDAMRADPLWKDVPILAMSAKSRPEDIESVLRKGANVYLTKPFRYHMMRETVARLLEESAATC